MMSNDQPSNDVDRLMFIGLTEFDNHDQRTIPQLAKSWEHSADGRRWTFHLRRGARFSDGHPITSADVLFSFAVAYDDSLHPSVQDALKVNGQRFRARGAGFLHRDHRTARHRWRCSQRWSGAVRIMPSHVLEARLAARRSSRPPTTSRTPPESLVTSGAWRLDAPRSRASARCLSPQSLLVRRRPLGPASAVSRRAGVRDRARPEHGGTQVPGRRRGRGGQREARGLRDLRESREGRAISRCTTSARRCNRISCGSISTGAPASPDAKARRSAGAVKHAWFADARFRRAVSKAIDRDAIMRGPLFGYGFKNWSTMTRGSQAVVHARDRRRRLRSRRRQAAAGPARHA